MIPVGMTAEQRIEQLENAIKNHRSQLADDRCVFDDDDLYATVGDGVKCDRRVGWKSYAELVSDNQLLAKAVMKKIEIRAWTVFFWGVAAGILWKIVMSAAYTFLTK